MHYLICVECKRELTEWRKQWAMSAARFIRQLKDRDHGSTTIHGNADSQAPEDLDE